jgi:type IV pilus assembly protein PilV
MKLPNKCTAQHGFSLVEVLVALIVVSIGLLGIAKMQALALASTGTAKMRSLAAIEAASLASTMYADHSYWGVLALPALNVSVASSGAVTSAEDSTLNSTKGARPPQCASAATPCTAAAIAALDLGEWADSLLTVLPNGTATINCVTNPGSCKITLQWTENVVTSDVGSNAAATQAQNAAANQAAAVTQSQYVLYVNP